MEYTVFPHSCVKIPVKNNVASPWLRQDGQSALHVRDTSAPACRCHGQYLINSRIQTAFAESSLAELFTPVFVKHQSLPNSLRKYEQPILVW